MGDKYYDSSDNEITVKGSPEDAEFTIDFKYGIKWDYETEKVITIDSITFKRK